MSVESRINYYKAIMEDLDMHELSDDETYDVYVEYRNGTFYKMTIEPEKYKIKKK